MNQSIEDILSGPEYFNCDRYKIRMKKTECVRRQTAPEIHSFEIDHTYTCCKDCKQGEDIKAEVGGQISEVRKKTRRPPRMDLVAGAQRTVPSDNKHEGAGDKKMEEKNKICSKCNKPKKIFEFGKKTGNPDGLNYICKQCKSDYMKEYNRQKKEGSAGSKINKRSKEKTYTGPTNGVNEKKRKPLKAGLQVDSTKAVSAEVVSSDRTTLSLDIAMLETQNSESTKEAARFIIAIVKKDLLGAVFQELRSK